MRKITAALVGAGLAVGTTAGAAGAASPLAYRIAVPIPVSQLTVIPGVQAALAAANQLDAVQDVTVDLSRISQLAPIAASAGLGLDQESDQPLIATIALTVDLQYQPPPPSD